MGGRVLHFLVAALAVGGLAAIGADRASSGVRRSETQSGGIFRISLNAASGIDYMDPALASSPPGWALLDTTCARLMSYPDKAAACGVPPAARGGGRLPVGLARRQDVHVPAAHAAFGSATGARCARARSPARSTACSRPR